MLIVCNKSLFCDRHEKEMRVAHGCGGAFPHTEMGCDPCPVYPDAKCIPVCTICKEKPGLEDNICPSCARKKKREARSENQEVQN